MAVLSAGAALLALSACSVGGSSEQPAVEKGDPLQSTSEQPRVSQEERAALKAYRGMWNDLTAAAAEADPKSPLLDDHASDGALLLLRYGMEKARKENVVSKGAPRIDPEVLSATADKVTLRDCVDGTHWLQYRKSGELKNDVPGGHGAADATVSLRDGVWKVSKLYLHETGTC
ncbi:hypothetical protein [Actinacidiphila sp. bgisy167]|uniref:hypothetical protein n=1 Tax=Actinacidiphila sp. bgisy167 TaxID=3413797 RepID=UPI003D75893F